MIPDVGSVPPDAAGGSIPDQGRVLGVDLGTVRIGVAISDRHQRVAAALSTLVRGRDRVEDRRALAQVAAEEEVVGVVVGLPLSLDGSVGPAARAALEEVTELIPLLQTAGAAVETVDERFTTVAAYQGLRAGRPQSRARRGRDARAAAVSNRTTPTVAAARQQVDSVAAALLLQSWLDRRLAMGSGAP